MSGGHYPSINHTRSSQEFVAPRHRLPITAPPRTPSSLMSSNSAVSSAHTSHTPWMNKHSFASNYHDNSGYYGRVVTRDYSSISRAHCNDESSAWSNPNFSNPLGNPPFGGVTATNENIETKGEVQQESMDLSAGHYVVPGAASATIVAAAPSNKLSVINGDASGGKLNSARVNAPPAASSRAETKKEPSVSVITTNVSSSTAEKATDQVSNSISVAAAAGTNITDTTGASVADHNATNPNLEQNIVPVAPDNVEFALESMFLSENRSPQSSCSSSSVIISTPLCQTSKDMCVESVEKLLKSPSPERVEEEDDDLAILEDSGTAKKLVDIWPSAPSTSATSQAVAAETTRNENCDCIVKADETATGGVGSTTSPSTKGGMAATCRSQRSNDKSGGCDVKNELCVGADHVSSALKRTPAIGATDTKVKTEAGNVNWSRQIASTEKSDSCSSNSASKTESGPVKESSAPPTVPPRNEEITYVEVENELEKMFAGIEDTAVNGADRDPLTTTTTTAAVTPQYNLSLISNTSGSCLNVQNNLSFISSSTNTSYAQSNNTSSFDGGVASSAPAKRRSNKKKTLKKSKSAAAAATRNVRDSKQKSTGSVKETSSSSMDNAIMKRVPVIHIEGSKENPISVHIINSIKSEEDDVSDGRTSAKRKMGKSDRVVQKSATNYAFKNYDPGTSDASWVCVFCNLCAYSPGMAGEATGDLFGPYFIRTPEQIQLDDSQRHSRRANHFEQAKKKQKRSLSVESGYVDSSVSEEQKSLEIWAHENCIVWASGVHLIGSKLIGLEEAIMQAANTICAHCSNKGASIGCRARHCNSCVHYTCALCTGWKLDPETFISTCSVHSGPHQ